MKEMNMRTIRGVAAYTNQRVYCLSCGNRLTDAEANDTLTPHLCQRCAIPRFERMYQAIMDADENIGPVMGGEGRSDEETESMVDSWQFLLGAIVASVLLVAAYLILF